MKLILSKLRFKNNSGFTIIEILVVVVFIGIISGLIFMTFRMSSETNQKILDIGTSEIDARTVMYKISKDIREAASINDARDDLIKFNSNRDDDDDYEEIYYYLEKSNGYYKLYEKIDDGKEKLIADYIVDSKFFIYYSDLGEESLKTPVSKSELENIRLIEININIDQSGAKSDRTMSLNTFITIRNKI